MASDSTERKRDFCQWPLRKKRRCNRKATIIYEVETRNGIGMCQEHFDKFCEMQENGHDEKARSLIGLPSRKTPYSQKEQEK